MLFIRFLSLVCLASPTLASSAARAGQAPDERGERIGAILRHCHEHGMFNGVLLAREGGKTIYAGAHGVLAPDGPTPLELDTRFLLGSVSKQFTAMAILLLEQDGELEVEDELTDFLPDCASFADGVTVHHLLTHSSGIPDYVNELGETRAGLTNSDVIEILKRHGRLNFAPGTRASYSNGGYVLLAQIVEEVTGEPLPAFLEERVFRPLGMESTYVRTAEDSMEDCAVGFDLVGTRREYEWFTSGPGGMISTIHDLAKWDDALANERLVDRETLERAFTPNRLWSGARTGFGYGWQVLRSGSMTRVYHMGASAGYRAYIHRDLQTDRALIVLSNCRHGISGESMRAIDRVFTGGSMPPLPRVELAPYLGSWIRTRGLEAALTRYDELRDEGDERFDWSDHEEQLNLLGYDCLSVGRTDLALALFRKNVEVHPDSWNAHDSLGEAWAASGERDEAIAEYVRSLELNPANDNARERLEELRASE